MTNINKELSRIKSLMNYGYINESKKQNDDSVEYTNKGADGKIYGIIREGSKYFIKVKNPNGKSLIPENFDYIGGFSNKKANEYNSYANALKQFDLKMMSLKEAFDNKESVIVESLNPNLKEKLVIEGIESMKDEISRQKQIMMNAKLISEGKTCGKDACCCGDAKKQGKPFGAKAKNNDYKEVKGDIYNEKGEPKVNEEEVLAWNRNADYMDKSNGTEVGDSAPFDKKANCNCKCNNGVVEEGKPSEPAPNEVNDWDKGLPNKAGVGEVGDSAPFDKKVNESVFDDEEDNQTIDGEIGTDDTDNVIDDTEAQDLDTELDNVEEDDDNLESLLQQVLDKLDNLEAKINDNNFSDDELYDNDEDSEEFDDNDDEMGDENDMNDFNDFDDDSMDKEDETVYYESKSYRKMMAESNRLNDFGKHPAYRKQPMELPSSNHQEMNGYHDWNDDSVKGEKPYGETIGDGQPFEIDPETIDNAIAESINRFLAKKKLMRENTSK